MQRACRYWGISRQAHYASLHRERQQQAQADGVVSAVQDLRRRQPRLGTRKLHHLLSPQWQASGMGLGRDALFDLLRQRRLLVPPRRAYHKTTDSHHHFRRHPNLLKGGADQVIAKAAEQVWVADITYLPTADHRKPAYLSLVTDAYSRKIVGWQVHETLQAEGVGRALKQALKGRQTQQTLVHHSDRGVQYCSEQVQQLHRKHGLTCSMTDGYDCYQNALAERVNGILKGELLLHRPANLEEARKMVSESVTIYNGERPHLSLQMKTPDAVHQASLAKLLNPNVHLTVST